MYQPDTAAAVDDTVPEPATPPSPLPLRVDSSRLFGDRRGW